MNNDLHYKITMEALERAKRGGASLPSSARSADLVAVEIDILDTLPRFYEGQFYKMNHDSPGAQHRHFMRIQGQTVEYAHKKAVKYIHEQALLAAAQFKSQRELWGEVKNAACQATVWGAQNTTAGHVAHGTATAGMLYKGQASAPLGLAIRRHEIPQSLCTAAWPLGVAAHTLEDSFSPSHVFRDGKYIRDIQVYAEQDHDDHDEKDASVVHYEDAVRAVTDLFLVVGASVRSKSAGLVGWSAFQMKWLTLKPNAERTPLNGGAAKSFPPKASSNHARLSSLNQQSHHMVRGGQSLSSIAGIYYQDVLLWPHLWDHNKGVVKNPNTLVVGMILNIPTKPPSDTVAAIKERGRNWRAYS